MSTDTRDGGLELSGDEILADGILFRDKKSPKDRLEVTIGDGMEFTIHGMMHNISFIIFIYRVNYLTQL